MFFSLPLAHIGIYDDQIHPEPATWFGEKSDEEWRLMEAFVTQ